MHRIAGTDDPNRVADIVFVHGLNPVSGDANRIAFGTWGGKDVNSDFWPKWLAEDLQKPENGGHKVGVWLSEYDSSASGWFGATMPLQDRATNILEGLYEERLGKKPIIFVCHSMGGLVIKKVLQRALTERKQEWREVANNVRGVVFLSTPHTGANFASFIGKLKFVLRLTDSVADLQENAPMLRELSEWYRDNCLGYGIDTRSYGETREMHGVLVVDETSANPHVERRTVTLLDADHNGVAALATRDTQPYKGVLRFVEECISKPLPRPFDLSAFRETSPWTPRERRAPEKRRNIPGTKIYGREGDVAELRKAFTAGGKAGVTQAITGLGGIGKTALAFGYAHDFAGEYDSLFYVNASGISALENSYRELAEQLGLPERGHPDPKIIVNAVKNRLNSLTNYLLILDNADFGPGYAVADLLPYLPERGANHWLVTSRTAGALTNLGVARNAMRELQELSPDAAVRLLWERVNGEGMAIPDEATVTLVKLTATLHHFPLALAQAAAYMAETGTEYGKYLRLYAAAERALPEPPSLADEGDADEQKHRKAVGTTWQVNIDALEASGAGVSVALLSFSAFLAPDNIPFEITFVASWGAIPKLEGWFKGMETEDDREIRFDALVQPLTRYALATKKDGEATFSVHRLVQRVLREAMTPVERKEWLDRAVDVLNATYPSPEFANWSLCARLTPHVQALQPRLQSAQHVTGDAARLYNQLALYLRSQSRLAEAESLSVAALAIGRKLLPANEPNIANVLDNLAVLYFEQNRLDESLPLCAEALHIRREVLPANHEDIANSLNNLASLYRLLRRIDEAEQLYGEALAILRQALPAKHPKIGQCLGNLAGLFRVQKRFDEAEPLYLEAVAIHRGVTPPNPPLIATSLNNLAGLYQDQNRLNEAEPLFVMALKLRRKTLPEKHLDIAVSLNNLALLYVLQRHYGKAEPLYKEALQILDESLPIGHPIRIFGKENMMRFHLERALHDMGVLSIDELMPILSDNSRPAEWKRSVTDAIQWLTENQEVLAGE